MQPAPQDNQLMPKHRVLSSKPQLRLEWRGQDGQNETEQSDQLRRFHCGINSDKVFGTHTFCNRAIDGFAHRAQHGCRRGDFGIGASFAVGGKALLVSARRGKNAAVVINLIGSG